MTPTDALTHCLAELAPPPRKVSVALSGGLDSVCLLHAAVAWARASGAQLSAHHVHHGLSPNADAWLAFCEARCAEWGVPFSHTRLQLVRGGGESLEAVARSARHAALSALDVDTVLFAHHQDDQVETFFLQLLRGAGPAGLAGMPAIQQRGLQRWVRPWLAVSRSKLKEYAQAHALSWVEDESNQDTRFDRNALRQQVLPELEARFPHYRDAVIRAMQWQRDALQGLEAVAAQDMTVCLEAGALDLARWRALPESRAHQLLRAWLRQGGHPSPRSGTLLQIAQQLRTARTDAQITVPLPQQAASVRVYRGRAWRVPDWSAPEQIIEVDWQAPWPLAVAAWHGQLQVEPSMGAGIAARHFQEAGWSFRPREGGERIKLTGRPAKTLKSLWQESGLAPWLRDRWPLLYCGDQLAWAPGVGYAADLAPKADESGYLLRWEEVDSAAPTGHRDDGPEAD